MEDFTLRLIDLNDAAAEDELEAISARGKMEMKEVNEAVAEILSAVRARGDEAVAEYTERFDGVKLAPENFRLTEEEIEEAKASLDPELLKDLAAAARSIRRFHEAQLINSQKVELEDEHGSKVSLIERPLRRVGIYVPGGTAPLPSSVLMNAIPASVAGVKEIVMCTPPDKNGKVSPVILAAASLAGVHEIYRIGGAQAIAALAYGTETVRQSDMVSGPGNIYVNAAKRMVFGTVAIDMFAGPSEILIIADESANPRFTARDMISQAEHDKLASAILITDSRRLAEEVGKAFKTFSETAARRDILKASSRDYCAILLARDLEEACALSNRFSPEHLEIMVKPEREAEVLGRIENAGAVFLGPWSPEPLGDYYAGPNHTLPTSGTARFFSPLNVSQFRKKISLINYKKESLLEAAPTIERLAAAEGLEGHMLAVRIRREEDDV